MIVQALILIFNFITTLYRPYSKLIQYINILLINIKKKKDTALY